MCKILIYRRLKNKYKYKTKVWDTFKGVPHLNISFLSNFLCLCICLFVSILCIKKRINKYTSLLTVLDNK